MPTLVEISLKRVKDWNAMKSKPMYEKLKERMITED